MTEEEQLVLGIATLEAQRALLGDVVVDSALAPMRARLQALRTAAQTLRQVSVLFLDVVGSTDLANRLDPEAVHAVMDQTLQACSEVVVAHGGSVLQYAGDSLLAAFGTPVSREDDAERAVHCGLALLPVGQALAERVLRDHGHAGCQVRVGIHTGPVLLGGGVDEGNTIRGATVNLAARMEQSAPPGRLRISQATWRQVRGVFEVEAQPPLRVKGHDEPLDTWLVLAPRPRAFRVPTRGIDGLETPMVGRAAELAAIVAAFEDTRRSGQTQACTVLADAGVGKSRLLQEVQHALDAHTQETWLLLGRAQPSTQLQPYGLLRDVLAWRLQIADSDSAEAARRKLVDALVPLLGADPSDAAQAQARLDAAALGQLIGMDFSAEPALAPLADAPRRLRDHALAAFVAFLRGLNAQDGSPVVLMLDDLQWADDASLDALMFVRDQADLPCLLLMCARPSLRDRRPAWGEDWPRHQTLALVELDSTEQQALTDALLARLHGAPPALRQLIQHHAAGNPFYAEELVKMLIDDGVIVVDSEGWTLRAERLAITHVPETLTGVLQARLDTLTPADRRALQLASVISPVFWDQALKALDHQAPDSLPTLSERAMVHARPESAFADARELSFQHHLLHQVTYDTVLKADRRTGHARAAAWLASRIGDRSAEYMGLVADHYERAGDPAQAFDWYERATREASKRFAQAEVIGYAERALALPRPEDLGRVADLLIKMLFASDVLGLRDLQARVLQQRWDLAEELDDDRLRASTLASQALLADRLSDYPRAEQLARQGAEVAERVDAASDAALCWGELSWLSRLRGDLEAAVQEVETALVWSRRAAEQGGGETIYEMQMLVVLSILQRDLHQPERARQTLQRALALAEKQRVLRAQTSCHLALGEIALALDDTETAAQHVAQMQALVESTGEVLHEAGVHLLRSDLLLQQGDLPASRSEALASAEVYARIGSRSYQVAALLQLAEIDLQLGDAEGAARSLDTATALAAGVDDVTHTMRCRALGALVRLRLADPAAAQSALQAIGPELLDLDGLASTEAGLIARMAAWEVWYATGDPRAATLLARVWAAVCRRTASLADPALRARALRATPVHRWVAEARRRSGVGGSDGLAGLGSPGGD